MGNLQKNDPRLQRGSFPKLFAISSPVYLTPPNRFATEFQVSVGILRGQEVIHV